MSRLSEKTGSLTPAWIGPEDPPPFETFNEGGGAPILLTCDHASPAIPKALFGLGLDESALLRHVTWDIGAGEMVRALARKFDAPAILSGYSRLLIDCNRPVESPGAIVVEADGVFVSGNADITPESRAARADAFYWPYHQKIARRIQEFLDRGIVPVVLSIHSFTPVFEGFERPWEIGVLWDRDPRIACPLMEILRDQYGVVVGDNEPYAGRDNYGYTMEHHVVGAGLPQVLLELRQDRIDTHHGIEAMLKILVPALGGIFDDPKLYCQAWFP
ncbi:MAG: hypothetical protein COA65_00300 [Rhodospirillaceae bacterium]|nr:MAG: hypothetical protein COA65_00300 [Rhodospirillaceae bacterium]